MWDKILFIKCYKIINAAQCSVTLKSVFQILKGGGQPGK